MNADRRRSHASTLARKGRSRGVSASGPALFVTLVLGALAGCRAVAGLDRYQECSPELCPNGDETSSTTDPPTTGPGPGFPDTGVPGYYGPCAFLGSCETLESDAGLVPEPHTCIEYSQSKEVDRPDCNPLKGKVWREGERCSSADIVLGCRIAKPIVGTVCIDQTLWFYPPTTREAVITACSDPIEHR